MLGAISNGTNDTMKLSDDFKHCLRHFVYYYTNGTLPYVIGDESILKNIDYREMLKTEASLVEQAFAIYANNIEMDDQGKVFAFVGVPPPCFVSPRTIPTH